MLFPRSPAVFDLLAKNTIHIGNFIVFEKLCVRKITHDFELLVVLLVIRNFTGTICRILRSAISEKN